MARKTSLPRNLEYAVGALSSAWNHAYAAQQQVTDRNSPEYDALSRTLGSIEEAQSHLWARHVPRQPE